MAGKTDGKGKVARGRTKGRTRGKKGRYRNYGRRTVAVILT